MGNDHGFTLSLMIHGLHEHLMCFRLHEQLLHA